MKGFGVFMVGLLAAVGGIAAKVGDSCVGISDDGSSETISSGTCSLVTDRISSEISSVLVVTSIELTGSPIG